MIKDHAVNKGYLSLGESHLQAATAIQVNFDLMDTYLQETKKSKTVFCTETLNHFLEPYGEHIKENVKRYKVFDKNSPYVTDFTGCKDRKKIQNYVTYSGFFHQYQFGKPFANEFPVTPVISDDGNNILAQMKGLEGLFVTQMELEYMEYSATRALINLKLTNAKELKSKAAHLESVVATLNSQMEDVIVTDDGFTSKKAVVVSSKDFDVSLGGNDKSFFVMTNLSYRTEADSLKALKSLVKLDDETLEKFLLKVKNSKSRIVSVFLGPFPGGNLGTVSYPGINRTFKGQSFMMQIRNAKEDYLMVHEPDAEDFVCVDFKTNKELSCF